jgi:hypothetical protein
MAAPSTASAASKRPRRVQQVLDHLAANPMLVSSIPMQYEAQPTAPLPACLQGLQPEDVVANCSTERKAHYARVILGLLHAACGGLDVAHNLVTPLCWGSWTSYAGAPISGSPAAADAAYVHAIVHRQEGHCDGEFGSGFSNANYWYAAAGEHSIAPKLLKAAASAAAGRCLNKQQPNHGSQSNINT